MVNPNLPTVPGPNIGAGTRTRAAELRRLLTEAIDASEKTRDQIAQEMTEKLGRTITKSILNEFTRTGDPDREPRFPATLVSAFCEATGCDELARFVMGPRLRRLLELGERVSTMGWVLTKIQDEVAGLTGQGRQKRRKGKRSPKAS